MASIGLLKPMSEASKFVCGRFDDHEWLKKGRMHPVSVLMAQSVFLKGQGFRGKLTWTPDHNILNAMDSAFVGCFQNVTPTGKNHLLALDVSGSMTFDYINGSFLTPRDGAAAMALVTSRLEPWTHTVAFSAGKVRKPGSGWNNDGITPVTWGSNAGLQEVIEKTSDWDFGGTDCALPCKYAIENELEVDAFVIYTDGETWNGDQHVSQALQEYRRKMGRPHAKMVCVGMVANRSSIADPTDPGTLDVVGFDAAAPRLMADFIRG